MKIALLGYGKMGKEIEKIALQKGHSISFKISTKNKEELDKISSQNTDIVIEFSSPKSAFENVEFCLKKGVSVVCGTTGWNENKAEIEKLVLDNNQNQTKNLAFFWASNFSIGVNIFLEINAYAAKLMQNYDNYNVEITETHHTEKKDAPSGTAITLAETILKNYNLREKWQLVEKNTPSNSYIKNNNIPIFADRKEDVKGKHTTIYSSNDDEILLTHDASSRQGFAKGAILAAEFLKGKKGLFGMKDLLNTNSL